MAQTLTVAAAQLGPSSPTKTQTVERMVHLMEEAGKQGVELLSFPELSLTPYFATKVHNAVDSFFEETLPSPTTQPLFQAAQRTKMHFVLPYAERDSGVYYNSAALVAPEGVVLGKYRKMHIPGWVEPRWEGLNILEKRYFALGNLGFSVAALPKVQTGMLICYDRRFSEGYRALALGGAELICVPYNTPTFGQPPAVGQETSEVLLRAGAMENQLFIVAVGKAGVEDGAEYIGGSEIIAPTGQVLAKAKTDGDELIVATIDMDEVRALRKKWDFLADRRPDTYHALVHEK
ncbi:MAG: D-N-carbamoylase [Deltaproteobacteria bacterium]|nr:D-N-carbamoylase [Deltaproteobacteria bacterium]